MGPNMSGDLIMSLGLAPHRVLLNAPRVFYVEVAAAAAADDDDAIHSIHNSDAAAADDLY